METIKGYDGITIAIGDRIEMHPGTDLWMSGARFGELVGSSITKGDRCKVKLDHTGKKLWTCSEDLIRKAHAITRGGDYEDCGTNAQKANQ